MAWEVLELKGTGDPFFGGSADDRPLGKEGAFLRGSYNLRQVAQFPTREDAAAAAARAPNAREGAKLAIYDCAARED